jgi:L-asparaginase type II
MHDHRHMNSTTPPKVAVLGTGGTIAGSGANNTQYAGYRPAVTPVDELLLAIPALRNIASLESEQVAQVASQNLGGATLLHLARRVNHWLNETDCTGVVVTVGTNTLEETAYFLNLVVKSRKTVVVTGAMRPSTSLSADGPMNLYRSVVAAASPLTAGLGVLVVMNDQIIAARDVHKMDTMTVDSFRAPVFGILGWVVDNQVRLYKRPARLHTVDTVFDTIGMTSLPRVDIAVGHQDDTGVAVAALADAGAQGLVVAGAGTASLSDAMAEAVRGVTQRGVVVVRAPRAATGIVMRNMEFADSAHGTVAGDTLSPAKARVLLALSLAHGMQTEAVQAAFDRY